MSTRVLGLAALLVAVAASAQAQPPGRAGDAAFGLPQAPAHRIATEAQRELGRKIFFDRRLSSNGTMSCGMCHVPEEGFTSNASQLALGLEGRSLARNAPTLINVAWQASLFHDGRATSLERQAWDPLLHPHEMGNRSRVQVLDKLRRLDDYAIRFERAYPGRGLGRATLGHALAAYERSLVAADSPFDRWFHGGGPRTLEQRAYSDRTLEQRAYSDRTLEQRAYSNRTLEQRAPSEPTLNERARAGYELFVGRARCATCHTIDARGSLFTDGAFHVTGAGQRVQASYDVPLAAGVSTRVDASTLASFAFKVDDDPGRFAVTKASGDRRAFKTPSLRNVALTAPYMHDGSLATLDEVIDFYDRGGGDVPGKSPVITPLALRTEDKAALRAFLESLTSPHIDALAAAARSRILSPLLRTPWPASTSPTSSPPSTGGANAHPRQTG
jgi:cytochrome c peroxidase